MIHKSQTIKRYVSRILQSYGWKKFPKISLGVLPAFISFEFALSLLAGYTVALFFAGRRSRMKGRFPSFTFQCRQYRIHLHHWLVFSHVIVLSFLLHFSVATPFLFYGFLGGVIAQGIVNYEDWHTIIQKV